MAAADLPRTGQGRVVAMITPSEKPMEISVLVKLWWTLDASMRSCAER
jgi:hypothetical protein